MPNGRGRAIAATGAAMSAMVSSAVTPQDAESGTFWLVSIQPTSG